MKSSKTIVEAYLSQSDWRVKENSNSPYCYGGLNKYMAGEVAKDYWLREVYPEYITKEYLCGKMHIHDLTGLTLYCCGYSLKKLIQTGVKGVPNIPTSAPARHFDSILNQISNMVTVYQNEIMGAVAFSSVDTLLAPFIKKDNLTYEEVKQSLQNFIFSINSNSRGGAEPAFSNVTLDLTPPKDLIDNYALIGNGYTDFKYRDCQKEMDMFNRAFCELMIEGDANGRPFAYPIPTYNIHERFDWNNPNNELLWEMAGKYGYPYFANFLNSDMKPEDARSMCPLKGDTKIIYYSNRIQKWCKSQIKDVYDNQLRTNDDITIKTIANGKIVNCRINKFNLPADYTIQLCNGLTIRTTGNHLNKVYGKDYIQTSELTTSDYLPVYKRPINLSTSMTYEQGKLVGMYIGDGSKKKNKIVFSLNRTTKQHLIDFLYDYAVDNFNAKIKEMECISTISGKASCVNVEVSSKSLIGLIEQFVSGDNALNKSLSADIVSTSEDFRKGIIDGLYETDGGNSNRIYTSSKNMVEDLTLLFATLGMSVRINEDNREGRLGNNTCYCVRYYTHGNKTRMKDVYIIDDNYVWFKIQNVSYTPYHSLASSYCLEVVDEDVPEEFMLANGVVTHNCRLRLDLTELQKRNGGLFGSGDSTGSIGVVTINLPRIAYETKGNKTAFFKELDRVLNIAKDSLEIKRQWLQKNVIETRLIPAFDTYVGTMRNHFSTIGIVGMNEMCENFFGEGNDILTDNGKDFCIEVGQYIRQKLLDFQKETGNLYNFEATPAESTAFRLAKKDIEEYPDIITRGTVKAPYYTNSCHIPVNKITSIKNTFDHQEDLQILFTGGTVIHIFIGGAISAETAKNIISTVCKEYKVPYVSISPLNRYCPEHGYIADKVDTCPICGAKLKMYQRITGYLRCVDNYNDGKASEFYDRKQLDPEEDN